MSKEPWNTGAGEAGEDMPRKSLDKCFTDYPVLKKGAMRLSLPPARTGAGRARERVKGQVPCGFLGQRPKPSESLWALLSVISVSTTKQVPL